MKETKHVITMGGVDDGFQSTDPPPKKNMKQTMQMLIHFTDLASVDRWPLLHQGDAQWRTPKRTGHSSYSSPLDPSSTATSQYLPGMVTPGDFTQGCSVKSTHL